VMAHPSLRAIGQGLGHVPLGDRSYVFLLAANVGAVIMPWMVFYQQGAVLDKGLQRWIFPVNAATRRSGLYSPRRS